MTPPLGQWHDVNATPPPVGVPLILLLITAAGSVAMFAKADSVAGNRVEWRLGADTERGDIITHYIVLPDLPTIHHNCKGSA